jgi:hypothetical protein
MELAYRTTEPITVLVGETGRARLTQLPEGAVLLCRDSSPDTIGMIEATYEGRHLLLFLRDVEERAIPLAAPLRRLERFRVASSQPA